MNFIRNNLVTVLVIIACVAAVVVYLRYFSGGGGSVLTTQSATSTVAGAGLLSSLNSLKQVTLDPSIFSDPSFLSLVDFGVAIPPEPVGRTDPFAPLSGIGGATGGNAGVLPGSVGR